MVNRVSSYFPKGGHSASQTELKIILAGPQRYGDLVLILKTKYVKDTFWIV